MLLLLSTFLHFNLYVFKMLFFWFLHVRLLINNYDIQIYLLQLYLKKKQLRYKKLEVENQI